MPRYLLGVYRAELFGSSRRRGMDVCVGPILVTARPSSRLPHVVSRWRDMDLFVFRRLPQFSNNFTRHVENGPGLSFESHGFRQQSAFLDQPGSRIDYVCH
jgi:hypothetical protein